MPQTPKPLEPPVRHAGSRIIPGVPHAARAFKALQRRVDHLGSIVRPQTLTAVDSDITAGKAATAASMTSLYRMRVYRAGATCYTDVAVGAGAGSVVQAQLTCPDLSTTGTAVSSAAGGEQVLRLSLDYPDAWAPGDAHWVYVQAMRSSGTDSTTLQVARAWQR